MMIGYETDTTGLGRVRKMNHAYCLSKINRHHKNTE